MRITRAHLFVGSLALAGCGGPRLARDGTLVLPQEGGNGSVLTANGVEYTDRISKPTPVVSRDPNEPWRAPIGFILPRDGRFVETSRPTVLATTGLGIVLRPSDTRVPSWGGEVLVRVDVLAPAAEGSARWGENVVLVVDGRGADTLRLAEAALEQLAGRDRVSIWDTAGPRLVLPFVPASNRSMALAVLEKRLSASTPGAPDLAATLTRVSAAMPKGPAAARVLLLTSGASDPYAKPTATALEALGRTSLSAVGTTPVSDYGRLSAFTALSGGTTGAAADVEARVEAVREAIPVSGVTMFRDVRLTFEGTPAPSHVLEATGGDVRWRLDAGELALGDVRAGEARTEVLRVTVPMWVPGERFHFTVTATYSPAGPAGATGSAGASGTGSAGPRRAFAATLPCVYDDNLERIAKSRNGDVIAYASAMATLKRLDAAFVGSSVQSIPGGLRALAELHARSMAALARDMKDPAIAAQADLLGAILGATR
ncbi:MAG: VWA domain-containing protein [Myxococcales bacterium]|nr:VWA domain-containing protein [Myxococcales bacterium]MBL0195380.1 VWA domain-containing protein [Myxococcales bacterium]HQY59943.1 hypothetical protein [Polyangiaceae bacterium]